MTSIHVRRASASPSVAAPTARRGFRSAVVLGLAMTGGLMTLAGPARAAGPEASRVGARPPVPMGAQPVGALPQATTMRATVALTPRDPAALAAYAEAVSTPGSGSYHSYLTVAEFVQRFGPSDRQIDAVRASLRARGLQVGALSANRLALSVGSTAGSLAAAFQTSFEQFRLPSGRLAYANTSAPAIAGDLVGAVQSVVGLDTLATPRPASLTRSVARDSAVTAPRVVTGPQPCSQARASGHTANQLASAYRFSGAYAAGDLGGGVTIALFELEPHRASDISAYQGCYTGTGTYGSISNVPVDGGAGTGAGTGEAALDIEDVVGLTPKANLLVYEGPNTNAGAYDTYNAIISQNTAQVISTSWGVCEAHASGAAAENTLFQEAAVQGQSIFAASGDTGSDDCGTGTAAAVDDPASQPYVTGVGGTTLSSLGPPPTETVWDNSSSGAGGGGVSSLWSMPSYQASAPAGLGVINARSSGSPCRSAGYCREVPDVSADADPNTGYAIYWSGAWHSFGGTSAAAPTWAALTALADASPACAGAKVGFANAAIYRAAAAGYRNGFNDVTSGSNSFNGAPGFTALPGFDMASGLGTPGSLTAALCGSADTVTIAGPGPQGATQGTVTSLQLHATSSAGTPITFAASNLPSGLSIDPASGLITGTPDTAGTWAVNATASDASSSTGAVSFTWSVAVRTVPAAIAPPPTPVVTVAKPVAQRGRVGVARGLQITAADSGHFALAYTATGLPAGLRINSSSGLISGTPARATRTTVTVRAGDGAGRSATTAFPWTIAGRPRVRASSVRLPAGGHARLSVSLLAGAHAAGIKRVVVSVPRDIRISLTARDRTRGIAAASTFGVHLSNTSDLLHAALVIRLVRSARNATLTLSSPQLSLSRRLSRNLRRRRVRTVRLVVTAIDSAGFRTRLFVRATVNLA